MFELCPDFFLPNNIEPVRMELCHGSRGKYLLFDYKTSDGVAHRAGIFEIEGQDPVASLNKLKSLFVEGIPSGDRHPGVGQSLEVPQFIADAARTVSKGKSIPIRSRPS